MEIRVERLHEMPVGVAALLSDSERVGTRIVRRLVDEWNDGTNRFDRAGEAFFGAFVDDRLVGVGGLNIDPYGADDRTGRVRHLYVLSEVRHGGVGHALTARVIAAGRGRFDRLRLRTSNPAAARLYEHLGFRATADASDATHVLPLGAMDIRKP